MSQKQSGTSWNGNARVRDLITPYLGKPIVADSYDPDDEDSLDDGLAVAFDWHTLDAEIITELEDTLGDIGEEEAEHFPCISLAVTEHDTIDPQIKVEQFLPFAFAEVGTDGDDLPTSVEDVIDYHAIYFLELEKDPMPVWQVEIDGTWVLGTFKKIADSLEELENFSPLKES